MKTIKFHPSLIKLVLSGEKNTTWRLFDDKDLSTNDTLSFLNSESKEEFAKAQITSVKETTFAKLNDEDWAGHEKFTTPEEMYKTYSLYYNQKVTPESTIKIIKFKLL